ncbi:MAG: tetratricopeptide repeat protein [Planctomycetia bacterium]|nr:tetratricopeptide repeat protein [Planctomycetia bacterium]
MRVLATALATLAMALSAAADRPAAEKAIAEGREAMRRSDFEGAVRAMDRAVEAAPDWATAWTERGFAKARGGWIVQALEDLGRALEIEPGATNVMSLRARVYMDLDLWQEAADQAAEVLSRAPANAYAQSLHGRALVELGEVDGGLAELRRAIAADPAFAGDLPSSLRLTADWPAIAQASRDAIRFNPGNCVSAISELISALVEQGKYDEARAAVAEGERLAPMTVGVALGKACLLGTPGAPGFSEAAANRELDASRETAYLSSTLNVHARILFLNGRIRECLDLLESRGRRSNFETLFWIGACRWKLGDLAGARAVLMDARRRNPYLAAHARRFPELAELVASVERELKGEFEWQGDASGMRAEQARHLLTVAEIEALVKRYQFARAVAEYELLLPELKSAARRTEVEGRLPEVKGMAGGLKRLVAAINGGGAKLKAAVGKSEITIVRATEGAFDFTIPKGEGRFPWAALDPDLFCGFAQDAGATGAELTGLGCLAWDAGRPATAARMFEAALKKDAKQKAAVTAFVARRRGIPPPDSGFVTWKGRFVTAAEKANLEKGLVLFEGQWVTAKDREQMAKGLVKVGDKWLPGDEAELLKRGYRKVDGKWMSAEDVAALRENWETAWVEETAHYAIRTNEGEAFAKDLAALIEEAYAEFREYYGSEPKLGPKEKMTLYAFRTFEDYRKHCIEQKAEDHLAAAGFARSDSLVVAGWNRTGNRQQFLQTMVHEAAHLYWFRVAPAAKAPSWFSEGMATYFEGFSWNGSRYSFNHVAEARLPFVREAMKAGRHMPLKDLLAADALALINSDSRKALLFYAQCWSLNFYLSVTENKAWRNAYADYRKAVTAGQPKTLLDFFPDAAKLESDWVRFVTGL